MARMASCSAKQRISVIVPTYNRSDFLPAAVASLVSQTSPPCEIIVVNDGSDYDVRALLRDQGPLVKVLDKENAGKPAAVNLGVSHAKGEYVWVFDDDDIAELDYIEKCQPHLESAAIDYVFGWHYAGESLSANQVNKTTERRPRLEADRDIFAALLSGCSIAHNAIIAKRTCYLELGGMDTSYPCSEDYEFQLRLAQRFAGHYLDLPSFTRRMHSGDRGGKEFRYRASERRQRFLEQDRRFIESYLEKLPISEYWIQSFERIEDERLRLRAQYLYKFQVAAGVGLWNVAVKTLQDAAGDPNCASSALSSHEVRQISDVFTYAEADVLARFELSAHAVAIDQLALTSPRLFLGDVKRTLLRSMAKRTMLQARNLHGYNTLQAARIFFNLLRHVRFRETGSG